MLPLVAQSADYASLVIGTIALFGPVLIVALAFNHLFGSAGIPAMSNRIPALIGSFTISAVTLRLVFIIVASAGVNLIEWRDDYSWVYNNQMNVGLVNGFIAGNPLFGIGILLFSLAAAAQMLLPATMCSLRSLFLDCLTAAASPGAVM